MKRRINPRCICGKTMQKHGFLRTLSRTYQRYRCINCGRTESRATHSNLPKQSTKTRPVRKKSKKQ